MLCKHRSDHNCHRCEICKKCYSREWDMKKHMKLRHPRPYPAPNISEISENEDRKKSEDVVKEVNLTGDRNVESLSGDGVKELSQKQRLDLIIKGLEEYHEKQIDIMKRWKVIKKKRIRIEKLKKSIKNSSILIVELKRDIKDVLQEL